MGWAWCQESAGRDWGWRVAGQGCWVVGQRQPYAPVERTSVILQQGVEGFYAAPLVLSVV